MALFVPRMSVWLGVEKKQLRCHQLRHHLRHGRHAGRSAFRSRTGQPSSLNTSRFHSRRLQGVESLGVVGHQPLQLVDPDRQRNRWKCLEQ